MIRTLACHSVIINRLDDNINFYFLNIDSEKFPITIYKILI